MSLWENLGRLGLRRPVSGAGRYGIAVLAVAVTLVIKILLSPLIGGQSAFLILSVAVLVGAVFGGLGPGILATLLGGLLVDYFIVPPVGTLTPPSAAHAFRSIIFVGEGLAISVIGSRLAFASLRASGDREEIRASEARLAEAQRIARLGNWNYEVASDEAYWSEELYRIFGFEPGEFVPAYRSFLELVHPDDKNILKQAIREAAAGSARSSVEYRILRPDGEVRAVLTEYEPIMDDSGRMVRIVGTIQDVTERRRAEESLRESEERYRVVAETASDAILVIDESGCMTFANEAAGRTFGYSAGELIGKPLTMLMPERLRDVHLSSFERHLETGERRLDWRSVELPGLHRSGREIALELSFGEFVRDGGKFVTGFVRDVTERKRIESELEVSEERFRSTFEQAAVGMAHAGFGGEWMRVNDKLCEIVGYTREELLGLTFQDLTHPEDLTSDLDEFYRLISGEVESYSREKRYIRKGGSPVWVNLTVTIGQDEAGPQAYTIAVVEDITARKRYEQELSRLASYPLLNPNPIVEADLDGVATYLNPAARELFPEHPGAGERHPLLEGLEDARQEEDLEALTEALSSEVRIGEKFYYRSISQVPQSGLLRVYATDITERRLAEDARKREEDRFRALIQYGSDIIVILDTSGTILYESPAIEHVMGYRPEERVGRSAFEFIDPLARERLSGVLSGFVDADPAVPVTVEYGGWAKDGSWHFFEAVGTNLLGDPSIGGIVINSRDITARKRMEEELRRSEERYRTVIEQMGEGIFMFDPGTKRLVETNTAFERMFGYTEQELQGMSLYDIVAHDPESVDANTRRNLEQQRLTVGERRYRRKDGALVDVEVSGSVISYGEDREIICAVVRDVSERRRAEEALRHSEALYRGVVEYATENIFLVDAETGGILESNAALYGSLGYTPEELSHMTIYDLVAADRESVERNVQLVVERGSHFLGERTYLRKDGSEVTVEVGASLIHREGRQTLCVVAHDIEYRKQREEAVREVRQAERSRMAREMHDNTLQDIIYALQEAQILEEMYAGEHEGSIREIVEFLRRSVEGIRVAIYELRLEEALKESFVMSIKNTVDLHRRMARRRHRIELEIDDEFPSTASLGIVRIVQEALTNARRHSEANVVTVSLRVDDGDALVEIADDGRGFDSESAESGVGTYSMRQRAQEMDANLCVESVPGSGTRIRLRVPVSELIDGQSSNPPDGHDRVR